MTFKRVITKERKEPLKGPKAFAVGAMLTGVLAGCATADGSMTMNGKLANCFNNFSRVCEISVAPGETIFSIDANGAKKEVKVVNVSDKGVRISITSTESKERAEASCTVRYDTNTADSCVTNPPEKAKRFNIISALKSFFGAKDIVISPGSSDNADIALLR